MKRSRPRVRRPRPEAHEAQGLAEIPALKNVAGTGTYTARFAVPASWLHDGRGVYLTLGRVYGSSSVSINGRRVTAATVRLPGDRYSVGELLRSGANTITVRSRHPPLNKLRGLGLRGDRAI